MRRALVLGCVAGILLAGCGQDEPELLAGSTASGDVGGGAAGSTEVCPESSDSRGSPAIASFGDGDLIVFAGAAAGCVFADGFVVSPDGERSPLPTSPFERPPLGPTAVLAVSFGVDITNESGRSWRPSWPT